MRDILAETAESFDFFPISILNARKKLIKAEYFLANLVGTVHCADMKKSEYKMSNIDKTQVRRFTRLILDDEKIREGTKIFRFGEKTQLYLVNDPFGSQIISDAECTGIGFTYLED